MKTLFYSVLTGALIAMLLSGCKNKAGNEDTQAISGQVIDHSECKSDKTVFTTASPDDSLSCVNYVFDASAHRLILNHLNAGFNCCPGNLSCDIYLVNDTIVVEEFEEAAQCNCNCLFDMEIEINDIKTGTYVIKFIEPYRKNQEQIIFDVHLTSQLEGSFCVTRHDYPWGVTGK